MGVRRISIADERVSYLQRKAENRMKKRTTVLLIAILCLFNVQLGSATDVPANFVGGTKQLELGPLNYGLVKPDKGMFVVIRRGGVQYPGPTDFTVIVLDGDGTKLFEHTPGLDVTDAWLVTIRDAALRDPGRLVVTMNVRVGTESQSVPLRPSEEDLSVWAEYNLATGDLIHLLWTTPTMCKSLHGDAHGTVWCLGGDNRKARAKNHDYDLIYRFDRDGVMVGSSLSRSSYPPELNPLSGVKTGKPKLLSGDGVYLTIAGYRQLIKFESNGQVAETIQLPEWSFPWVKEELAVAPDGEVYALLMAGVMSEGPSTWSQSLFRLSSDRESWIATHETPPELPLGALLVGADNSGVILSDRSTQGLVWHPVSPAVPVSPAGPLVR